MSTPDSRRSSYQCSLSEEQEHNQGTQIQKLAHPGAKVGLRFRIAAISVSVLCTLSCLCFACGLSFAKNAQIKEIQKTTLGLSALGNTLEDAASVPAQDKNEEESLLGELDREKQDKDGDDSEDNKAVEKTNTDKEDIGQAQILADKSKNEEESATDSSVNDTSITRAPSVKKARPYKIVHHNAFRRVKIYKTLHHKAARYKRTSSGGVIHIRKIPCPICGLRHQQSYDERVLDHYKLIVCKVCGKKHKKAFDQRVYL